jgi:organic hydroperoxide reductase OsmC/OhrA
MGNQERWMELTVEHVDGMRFLVTADNHSVIVDAAPEDGGGGTAMNAPQLFVAALGACILEFVLNSCRLRGVTAERLSLALTYEEVPRPRRVDSLQATLHIEPEPPDDVQRRLVGVARHATLASTLARPPEIHIQFSNEGGEGAVSSSAGTVLEVRAGDEP